MANYKVKASFTMLCCRRINTLTMSVDIDKTWTKSLRNSCGWDENTKPADAKMGR